MSHIGRLPIVIPPNVKVELGQENQVTVVGPRGSLSARFRPEARLQKTDGHITVERAAEDKLSRSVHGLTRALLQNMVQGVVQGYQKDLEVFGTGYRAQQTGGTLTLQLGFSHPVEFTPPPGITVTVAGANRLVITGCDKQQVGQVAAQIRAFRPPDSYKGKGVRYAGEVLHLKPGKATARK